MTPRQRDAFNFIKTYIAEKGFSPTYREITSALGIKSRARTYFLVDMLIEQNYLSKGDNGHSRNLSVVTHCCPHCKGSL